jgi:hypothetical protein
LEDQVAKLLLLTENSFQDWTVEAINGLVRTIQQVNEEFLDTKILLHASVLNIVNRGVGPDNDSLVARPFKVLKCYYNLPYEYSKETTIPHLQLADGDSAAENDWDKFVDPISKKMRQFPFCKFSILVSFQDIPQPWNIGLTTACLLRSQQPRQCGADTKDVLVNVPACSPSSFHGLWLATLCDGSLDLRD